MKRSAGFTLILVLSLLLLTTAGAIIARAATTQNASPQETSVVEFAPGRLLVAFEPAVKAERQAAILDNHDLSLIKRVDALELHVVRVEEGRELELAGQLSRQQGVRYAEPDYLMHADGDPNDPLFSTYQWNMTKINAPAAWDISTGSSSITIAIIDTGIDIDHPELIGRTVAGYDFINDDDLAWDDKGHGTHVAGIAGAISNNGVGVAGLDWQARLMPVKVLDNNGDGTAGGVADGIQWAADHGADVINLSLSGEGYSSALYDAVEYAHGLGVVIIASAGNDYETGNDTCYPAALDHVIAVAATSTEDGHAYYPNTGSYVDIAAPGGDARISSTYVIQSTYLDDCYSGLQGTSMAAPHVAGLAALLLAIDPTLTPAQVESAIESTATDLGDPGRDDVFGWGLIDAYAAALDAQGERTVTPEPTATATATPTALPACQSLAGPGEITNGTVISFDDQSSGTVLGTVYQNSYGVTFEDNSFTKAMVRQETDNAHSSPNVAFNSPNMPYMGVNYPMRIYFDEPKTDVGFWAGFGMAPDITARLIAYDNLSQPVCEASHSPVPVQHTMFIGIHDPAGRISSVSLNYVDSEVSEAIDDLIIAPAAGPATATPTATATATATLETTPTPTATATATGTATATPTATATATTENPSFTMCAAQTAVPETECDALVALYNSTDGANWTDHAGWMETSDLCTWYGIACSTGHISEVQLNDNNLSGNIAVELGNLSALGYLNLASNHLSGTIPPELGNLSNLSRLELTNNQLNENIPSELGNLSNLGYLLLSRNQLSGAIPPELGNLSNLLYLVLDTNQLDGAIPVELTNLSGLENLFLNTNQLDGVIPPELGNMGNLQYLGLYDNQLTGTIPSELSNLSDLRSLNLHHNQLSGTIPTELGNLSNLTSMLLNANQLSGTLPSELGSLSKLSVLHLDYNQLDGAIPPELGNLVILNELRLNSNQFTGDVPAGIANLTYVTDLDIGYNGLGTAAGAQAFLDEKDPDWADTQTVPPADVAAVASGDSAIQLTWTPITYTSNGGHYEVYIATDEAGPFTRHGITADKTTGSYLVEGLATGTTYYFMIRTYTPAHTGNQNNLWSEYSDTVSAVPGGVDPTPTPTATATATATATFEPAGEVIVFTHGSSHGAADTEIWLVRPDGSDLRQLTDDDTLDWCPALSPGANRIAFSSVHEGSDALHIMDIDGSNERLLHTSANCVKWISADSVTFKANLDETESKYWSLNVDSGAIAEYPAVTTDYRWPDISLDGTKFVAGYHRYDGEPEWALHTFGEDGSNVDSIGGYQPRAPAWSPDGGLIAYESYMGNLRVIDAIGSSESSLSTVRSAFGPRWSPDGSQIVYAAIFNGEVRIINRDGTGDHAVPGISGNYVGIVDWGLIGATPPATATPTPTSDGSPTPTRTPTATPTDDPTHIDSYSNHFTDLDGWVQGAGLLNDHCGTGYTTPIEQAGSIIYGTDPGGNHNRAGYVELPGILTGSDELVVEVKARYNQDHDFAIGLTAHNDYTCDAVQWMNNIGWALSWHGETSDSVRFTFNHENEPDGLRYVWHDKTHDDDWHVWRMVRGADRYWDVYEDDVLILESLSPDYSDNYRYLTVQGQFYGGTMAEIDYIDVRNVSSSQIPVAAGWNLLSIPIAPADTAISTIMAGHQDDYTSIRANLAADTADPWKTYRPGAGGDLTPLDHSQGFWIEATTPFTLTVQGEAPATTEIPLVAGWNLVGYPASAPADVATATAGISAQLLTVRTYNTEAGAWQRYEPGAPAYGNTLTEFTPTRGYWIEVSENCTWTVTY